MHCFLLQDHLTIRGDTSVASLSQGEAGWLDLSAFQDVVFWFDLVEFTVGGGALTINLETAPSRDETSFVSLVALTTAKGIGVTVASVLKDTAANPLARWVRWRFSTSGTSSSWDMTFRIWVAANAVGQSRVSGAGSVPEYVKENGTQPQPRIAALAHRIGDLTSSTSRRDRSGPAFTVGLGDYDPTRAR